MNRNPGYDNPNSTGWLLTDAKLFVGCPKCGAVPGEDCRTPKGRKAWPPHTLRTVEYSKQYGPLRGK